MRFKHVDYTQITGKHSKRVESYNFHKAAGVLAEYGFDCIRVSDDWEGVDFLAHHKSGEVLKVQLKSCLVISRKYLDDQNLYMCFPLDETGNWYLIKHDDLFEVIQEHAPQWLETNKWKEGGFFNYRGKPVLQALEKYAYRSRYPDYGFREARNKEQATRKG